MKYIYDVSGASLKERNRKPRIVQVHLKSIVNHDTPLRNPISESCPYDEEVKDRLGDSCNEVSFDNTDSFETSYNKKRVSSVESFKSSLQKIPLNLSRSMSYWLLFPAQMRKVLMYSSEKNTLSSSNISQEESDDNSNSSSDAPDSFSLTRKFSRRASMRSRKVRLDSVIPSSEEVWPVGEFRRKEPKVWENCYRVTWKDGFQDENNNHNTIDNGDISDNYENRRSEDSTDTTSIISVNKTNNNSNSPEKEHIEQKQFRSSYRRRKSSHCFHESSVVRHIYGYSSDESPTKKCLKKFSKSCCS